jgi:hypothetical protein
MKQHGTYFDVKAAKTKTVLQFPPSRELTLRGTYARLQCLPSFQMNCISNDKTTIQVQPSLIMVRYPNCQNTYTDKCDWD